MTAPFRQIALSCAVVLALAACKKQEQMQMPPPEVGVITAQPKTVALERDMVGRLAPFRSADVRARVPGVLLKRVYDEGTDVRQGQVLFRIDPAPLQADLSSSQAALASAQATYTNAKVAADRARQLAPQKFVSRADLDNAEAAERSAAAAVQQARAALANARINLGYAEVAAPISGRAGKQQVTEGALVGQGDVTLLTTIDQIDPLYVNFSMSVDELQALRAAQNGGGVSLAGNGKASVQVLLPNGRTYGQTGTLDFSDTVVDPSTGAVSLRAQLPNPDRSLLPGAFVTLKANLGQQDGVYAIPQAAVLRDAKGAYVLVVDKDGKAARKNVDTDRAQGGDWLVSQGLAAGDQVIVSGVQKAKEGQPAKAVPFQAQTAVAAGPSPQGAGQPAASGTAE